jgi:hypothetical protein
MNKMDFDSVNAYLKKKLHDSGASMMGLSGINHDSNGSTYYDVSINKESVDIVSSYGSVSETLEDRGDRANFRLYLDEMDDFLK